MSESPLRAFFLVGPTASGKSAVAQLLAQKMNAAILSADSMLVYQGMDIGTAKPSAKDRARVPYHGVDLVNPDRDFSVYDYRKAVLASVRSSASGAQPILAVGGTGLYVRALTDGLDVVQGTRGDERGRWEAMLAEQGLASLLEELRRLNPAVYADLPDKQNPRRVIRALEIASDTTAFRVRSWQKEPAAQSATPLIGLMPDPETLGRRIEQRVTRMYEEGLTDEVLGLVGRYGELSRSAGQAIGYAEVLAYLNGKCTCREAQERTVVRTRQLAKKQRTWFRHQARVEWIEPDAKHASDVRWLAARVKGAWDKYGDTEIRE
jgi:tRNA dimethylallyltransferase